MAQDLGIFFRGPGRHMLAVSGCSDPSTGSALSVMRGWSQDAEMQALVLRCL